METETQPAMRPVTLTLSGTAREVSPSVLRVQLTGAPGVLLIDNSTGAVHIEWGEAARTWTDHDVVQDVTHGRVWRRTVREDGSNRWIGGVLSTLTDGAVTRGVATGELRVLRYQAGEVKA